MFCTVTILLTFSVSFTYSQKPKPGDASKEIEHIQLRLFHSQSTLFEKKMNERVPHILASLHDSGSFKDIDYTTSFKRGSIPFKEHATRLNHLSQSYRIDDPMNKWHLNERLKNRIIKSYEYLAFHSPPNEDRNWWGHKIGLPLSMYLGIVLMKNDLPDKVKSGMLHRFWVGPKVWDEKDQTGSNAGSNFAYRAYLGIVESLLRGKEEFVKRHLSVMKGIHRELIAMRGYREEGIQEDRCLHQHNLVSRESSQLSSGTFVKHLVYNGEYSGTLTKLVEMATLFSDTSFQLPYRAMSTLREALLDCHQWFAWNTAFDPTVCGRKVTANAPVTLWASRTARDVAKLLLPFGERTEELEQLIARFGKRKPDRGTELVGNRGFFRSDMMVHRRAGYMVSVRMLSDRTVRPETWPGTTNNPNGYYMGDGFTTVMSHGLEFGRKGKEIFQFYDWELIPGSTVAYTGNPPKVKTSNRLLKYATGLTSFVGSASTGLYGVAGMTYARYAVSVSAKKAWMFFDDEIVIMTADLNVDEKKNNVLSTFAQESLLGPVTTKFDKDQYAKFTDGKHDFLEPKWLHHNSTAYVFVEGVENLETRATTHEVKAGVKTGVFAAYTNHGNRPNGVHFAYIVKPETYHPSDVDNYVENLAVRVFRNDRDVQGAYHARLDLSELVIYTAGPVILPTGTRLTVNVQCFLVVQEKNDFVIAVSNPDVGGANLIVEVNRRLSGMDAEYDAKREVTVLTFRLASGRLSGKSLVKSFSYE